MTTKRGVKAGAGVAAALWALCGVVAAFAEDIDTSAVCAVPEEMATTERPLPHLRARLEAGEVARIVVMGSGSSSGMGASTKADAYPERLAGELAKRSPGRKFTVVNLSKRGQLASDMEKRFSTEVAAENPALVIWQTGTVDAVRAVDLANFAQVLGAGIDELRRQGADVILMNSQYSPHTSAALDTGPYREVMHWVIQNRGAILFHRYTIMKYWEEEGTTDFTSPSKTEQAKYGDFVHHCIAYLLAEEIESALKAEAGEETKP